MGVSVRVRRAGVLALASAGAVSAHQLGYSTAALLGERASTVSHGHLVLLGWLAGIAAAAAVLGLAAAGARRTSCCAGVSLRPLLVVQLALYGWLEIAERLLHGEPLLGLLSTSVVLGLAAQPLTAWTLVLLLAVTTHAARRLLRRPGLPVVPARLRVPRRAPAPRCPRLVLPPSGSRAPPVRA